MSRLNKKKRTYTASIISIVAIVIAGIVIVFLSNEEFLVNSRSTVNPVMAVIMAVLALLVGILVFVHRNFRK